MSARFFRCISRELQGTSSLAATVIGCLVAGLIFCAALALALLWTNRWFLLAVVVAVLALTGCNRGTRSAWPTQPPAFTGMGSQLSRHELAPFRRRTVQSYAAPIRAEDTEGWADLSTAEQDTVRTYLASRRSAP